MGAMDDHSLTAAVSVQGAAAAVPAGRAAPISTTGPASDTLQLAAGGVDLPAALPANPAGTAATVASAAASLVVPAGSKCSSTMRPAELTAPG